MSSPSSSSKHTKQENEPTRIGLLLLPAFNSMAVNAFLDPFRIANYLRREPIYQWEFLSIAGGTVAASNGSKLSETVCYLDLETRLDFLVVNASWTPENFQETILQRWLKDYARQNVSLVGIDTGAFVLAYAGLMDGYQATVHYEHLVSFEELFLKANVTDSLFVIDRDRLSCCGGVAALDLSLEIIRLRQGVGLANAIASYLFKDRLRGGDEKQQTYLYEPQGQVLPDVLQEVLLLMEQHLKEVLPLPELALRTGVSQRQLERLFHTHIGLTPKRYYLNIRLNQARSLLTQTELSIAQIGAACGFNSAAHFARAYKAQFKNAPSLDRVEGRQPFRYQI